MAHTVTVTILVDEAEESNVTDSINEMLRKHWVENGGNVIDWAIDHSGEVCEEMNDSIANGTYEEGDAFRVQIPFFMIKQSNDMISLIDGHDQRL